MQLRLFVWCIFCIVIFLQTGCRTSTGYLKKADRLAYKAIENEEQKLFGKSSDFNVMQPSDRLRNRLLKEQNLAIAGSFSLGVEELEPYEHWPEEGYPYEDVSSMVSAKLEEGQPFQVNLVSALHIGARNQFEYQRLKEVVFQAALDLDLERNTFRSIFQADADTSLTADFSQTKDVIGAEAGAGASWSKLLKTGQSIAASLAVDVVKLLTLDKSSAFGLLGDGTISIPLLRGAAAFVVQEPLIQAERNLIYRIYELERFKKTYAVEVAKRIKSKQCR